MIGYNAAGRRARHRADNRSPHDCPNGKRNTVIHRRCPYCGVEVVANGRRLTSWRVDHIVPVRHGGRTDAEKLVTACRARNLRKGGRTPEEAGMRALSLLELPRS